MNKLQTFVCLSLIADIAVAIYVFSQVDGWLSLPAAFGAFLITGFISGMIATLFAGDDY